MVSMSKPDPGEFVCVVVPARSYRAVFVRTYQNVRIVNVEGTQVADMWAFAAHDADEWMSMEHTRLRNGRISPAVADALVTNRGNVAFTCTEDNSGGVHDTLLPACDRARYARLGFVGYHENCVDNLQAALRKYEIAPRNLPSPLNLFENAPISAGGEIAIQPPMASPGSYICFRADMDLLLVISACPQDLLPTNGAAMRPSDVHIHLIG